MSGQPLQNPLDADKFRREYLSQLKVRAELDDLNLQANKVYKRTGQKNELQDYRTASEKLADREEVKRRVRGELQKVMSPQIASEVISSIDDRDMVFLAQNLETMIPALKKMYAVGITEADQFLDYFNRYAEKLHRTGGVEMGLQQRTGQDILMSLDILERQAVDRRQIDEIMDLLQNADYLGRRNQQRIADELRMINLFLDTLQDDISDILRNSGAYDPNVIADIQTILDNISKNLPTRIQVDTILNRIDVLDRAGDREGIRGKVGELVEIMSQDGSFGLEMRQLRDILDRIEGRQEERRRTIYISPEQLESKSSANISTYIDALIDRIGAVELSSVIGMNPNSLKTFGRLIDRKQFLRENDAAIREALAIAEGRAGGGGREVAGRGVKGCGQMPCRCIAGTGLTRRAYTPKPDDVDESAGLAPSPKYVKMGRYLIHKSKMADDIISIRRPSGTFVGDFPSQRVSKNLGKVFRSIVGGGVPTYDDINSLNEEERHYLYKLAKSARIDDKLNIPAPKMEDDDKDVRRFEVLKGQIMSGQDNREMVKEFKILLLKLSKKGLVPKGQVKDILVDLASMGF
jgi:hypothetical protein